LLSFENQLRNFKHVLIHIIKHNLDELWNAFLKGIIELRCIMMLLSFPIFSIETLISRKSFLEKERDFYIRIEKNA